MVENLQVEVVYARREQASRVKLTLAAGSTLRDAVRASGLLAKHAEIDPARHRVGVFGKLKSLDDPLQTGDRVEIYRPLLVDPKENRRRRAAKKAAIKSTSR